MSRSPVLPHHMDADADMAEMDIHAQRNMMSRLVMESWSAIEVAALSIPEEQHAHAILGRLGGSGFDSTRSRFDSTRSPMPSPMINEKTRLNRQRQQQQPQKEEEGPPPLMKWIWIALACAMCYALYNISIKKGSASINPILGGVILQFVAALLGSLLLSIMICRGMGSEIKYDKKGVSWSIGAGLWVGTAEIVSFVVSGMGVPATQFIPIIIGGSVMFGSVLGVVTLGETVMCHGWSGVAMLCIGIAMVATDSGEKVGEGGGEIGAEEAPPLLTWIGPALFCALAYALVSE
jgi:transporter family protein